MKELRGELTGQRLSVVQRAWENIDTFTRGKVQLEDLCRTFNPLGKGIDFLVLFFLCVLIPVVLTYFGCFLFQKTISCFICFFCSDAYACGPFFLPSMYTILITCLDACLDQPTIV